MTVPVLIVCYKRSENVSRLLTSVCEQGVKNIYLAIDGSKDGDSLISDLIELESKKISNSFGVNLYIWKRDENLGPAVSVITAIDWFFSRENSGIILEDDLVISPQLIMYFTLMLERFETDTDVMMLSGTQFVTSGNLKQLQWTSYPVIWGWATWSNRWASYRHSLINPKGINVDRKGKEGWFWKTGLRRCASGILDAWDIPLAGFQLIQNKKTILPPVNLVSNHGADIFAGNTFVEKWPLNMKVQILPKNFAQMVLNLNETSFSLDAFIRTEIYDLDRMTILYPFISRILDYKRYPFWIRKPKLTIRLRSVTLPYRSFT